MLSTRTEAEWATLKYQYAAARVRVVQRAWNRKQATDADVREARTKERTALKRLMSVDRG